MLEKLSESSGNILGYKAIGKITKDDYTILTADVENLLQQEGGIGLLLDLESLKGEEFKAWGDDLKFGRDFRKKIDKMAIIGNKRWQKWMTVIVDPFFAREAKFFATDERDAAWEWLQT